MAGFGCDVFWHTILPPQGKAAHAEGDCLGLRRRLVRGQCDLMTSREVYTGSIACIVRRHRASRVADFVPTPIFKYCFMSLFVVHVHVMWCPPSCAAKRIGGA